MRNLTSNREVTDMHEDHSHEDHLMRPVTDAELETVVGGATANNAAVQEMYESDLDNTWGQAGSGGRLPVLVARMLDSYSEMIESLADGVGGPRGRLDGITGDQGEDGH